MLERFAVAGRGAALKGVLGVEDGAAGPAKFTGWNVVGCGGGTPFDAALDSILKVSARVGCGDAFSPFAARLWYF